jgi:hypothetical protein
VLAVLTVLVVALVSLRDASSMTLSRSPGGVSGTRSWEGDAFVRFRVERVKGGMGHSGVRKMFAL